MKFKLTMLVILACSFASAQTTLPETISDVLIAYAKPDIHPSRPATVISACGTTLTSGAYTISTLIHVTLSTTPCLTIAATANVQLTCSSNTTAGIYGDPRTIDIVGDTGGYQVWIQNCSIGNSTIPTSSPAITDYAFSMTRSSNMVLKSNKIFNGANWKLADGMIIGVTAGASPFNYVATDANTFQDLQGTFTNADNLGMIGNNFLHHTQYVVHYAQLNGPVNILGGKTVVIQNNYCDGAYFAPTESTPAKSSLDDCFLLVDVRNPQVYYNTALNFQDAAYETAGYSADGAIKFNACGVTLDQKALGLHANGCVTSYWCTNMWNMDIDFNYGVNLPTMLIFARWDSGDPNSNPRIGPNQCRGPAITGQSPGLRPCTSVYESSNWPCPTNGGVPSEITPQFAGIRMEVNSLWNPDVVPNGTYARFVCGSPNPTGVCYGAENYPSSTLGSFYYSGVPIGINAQTSSNNLSITTTGTTPCASALGSPSTSACSYNQIGSSTFVAAYAPFAIPTTAFVDDGWTQCRNNPNVASGTNPIGCIFNP